jgi:hypothetical protein
MIRRRQFPFIVISCLLLFVTGLSAQTLQVIDTEGHATTLDAAQISSLPRLTVKTLDHDKSAEFEGVSLASLLSLAGVQLGDKLRGPRLTEVLLVEAADGYKVAFALAEVDPAFAVRDIIVANKRDGKLLDAKEGSWRVVAPGDKRPARWIRQITVLRLIAVK